MNPTIELRGLTLSIDPDVHTIEGAGMSAREAGVVEGRARIATVKTADGFHATIGVCTWPTGDDGHEHDIRLLDFWAGADDYRRLERAGKMSLAKVGDRRVGILRAMAYGENEWPTLQSVKWEALDRLAGTDVAALLREHGGETRSVIELNPAAKRFKDAPGFAIGDDPTAAFVAFAITRVMPIARGFGKPGLELLHA
ncbi:MAG: hypothetical protein KJ659_04250 [Actinobacteria bacterium]|nr:hypothetical protein [Actinomycetota bacterium]MBU1609613.1 hypothetical protein [Actinomycetota bacterium]MBU2315448.1 hypothetical protein [Actinomycetota bacterium]MBU2384698.1 hypothetical protein [Actinomycetota bacterium]